jgi:photosystem II stability/assembly factor-like uncharacterized protein
MRAARTMPAAAFTTAALTTAAALTTLAVFAAGCAPGKSTLDVTVDSATPLSAVDHLRVALTDAAGKKAMDVTVPVPGGAIPPAVAFALRFPSTVKGKVTLSVDAMPASGAALAGASQDVDIQPSKRSSVAVQLAPGVHATQLAFTVQPSDSAVAASIKPPVQVTLQDADGMPVAADGIAVTLALGDNPPGATLAGTLTAMTAGGVASFADLKLDKVGAGFTLTASADALATATSTAFKVTPPAWVAVNSGLYGGNINRLVVDPKHTATLYAATREGGVWKTVDAGAHWAPASSGLPVGSAISTVAIDPTTTTTLYAMAIDPTASPAAASDGVYKTVDGGTSWARLAASPAAANAPYGHIVVDPSNSQNVTVAASRAINRSTNGGTSFTPLTATITYGPGVRDMAVDSSGTVWIACYGDGIQKIAINVTMFTAVGGTNLPTGHSSCCYYTAVAVEPDASAYVYASIDSAMPNTVRSIDSGTTWTATNAPIVQRFAFGTPSGGTTVRYAISGKTIYSSADGATWMQAGNNTLADSAQALAVVADNSAQYVGSQAGVYKLSGFAWALSNTGMTANPVSALTIDPKSPNTLFAALINAGQVRTTDGGGSWSPPAAAGAIPVTSGVITDIAVDETDNQLVWAAPGFPYRSTDGGATWAQVAGGSASGTAIAAAPSMSGTFYLAGMGNGYKIDAGSSTWMTAGAGLPASSASAALVVHPTSPMTVYDATASGGIYATIDAGATWTARNSGLGSLKTTSLAIDRMTPTKLLAGTADMGLFQSTDGSATWTATGTGLTSMAVSAVVISRSNPMVVYVGTRGAGVFRSGDGGATFVANSAGLPSLYITRLAIDPANPQIVYAGTIDGGVAKTAP